MVVSLIPAAVSDGATAVHALGGDSVAMGGLPADDAIRAASVTVTITTPESDATIARGATVVADYSCTEEPGGSGLDTCVGTVPVGAAIDTTTLGNFTFTVTATERKGDVTTVTHLYTVVDAIDPTVTITTPRPTHLRSAGVNRARRLLLQ